MFDHGGKGREKVDNEVAADGESKRQMPAISLPKGGGSMRGIGEKFSVNAVNGTASISMPITATPGRSGFGPQLSLSYNSGAGNGPFGLGWNLSIPSITRKTDKGLPRYQDTGNPDIFILSDAEDLVPCLAENDQEPEITGEDGRTYFIRRYRPRIEGLFARIERRVDKQTGDTHWQSVSKDNITTVYGRSPECRLADPRDKSCVFSWLIEESYDDKGNVIIYEYKQEDRENIDQSQPQEKNRLAGVFANRHIKRIKYGNKQPYQRDDWLFQVVFDYGDHHPDISGVDPDQTWACRQDPFSAYRAGFEIRTYRLCRRVLMFHHFAELGDNPCLVRSTDFGYRPDPVVTGLTSVVQVGYVRDENGLYRKKTLPPVEFSYTGSKIDEEIHSIEPESLENLPVGLDGAQYQWLDLDSEGISGILSEQAGAWFYKSNLGNGRFAPVQVVSRQPALANLNGGLQQIMDLAGDGHKYLVQFSPPLSGYYERTGDGDWDSFTPFQSLPNIALNDLNLKFIDLTGDGFADILISEDEVFVWYPSRGRQGFGPSEVVRKLNDEEQGPALVFSDANQSIHLADMSGDGLVDLVRIRNGQVCYWPNLGYGRFGAKVEMNGAPWFDCPDQFNPGRIRLADVDGSGPTDIIYLGRDSITIWFNQAGNSWSEQHLLPVFPAADYLAAVHVVDLMGNGTACLVWSSPLPGDRRRPMRYINLMGGVKPYLLQSIRNNLGAETRVQYAASTRFYLDDRAAGRPWVTKLPFPVQVVERVEIYDRISQNHFVTRYAYHHGYYDGVEREFRGFGLVEQWDTEEFAVLYEDGVLPSATNLTEASHVPPVYTKTWFHTGAYFDGTKVARHFETEYYREPDLTPDQFRAMLLDDTVLPAGLSVEEERQACRALKGSVLRQEVYAEDNSVNSRHPYTVSEHNYHVRSLQPQADGNPYAVFFVHPRETVNYYYEREITKQDPNDSNSPTVADPRVSHQIILKVDQYGNVERSLSIGYPRRAVSGRRPEQEETHIAFTVGRFANCADQQDWYRIGLPVETRTYEIVKPPQPGVTPALVRLFTFKEMQTLTEVLFPTDKIEPDPAKTWPYEKWDWRKGGDMPPEPRLRLVEHVRTLYRRNDLAGPLSLGEAESLALPYDSYKLAFTPDLLKQVFGNRVDDALMQNEGKYVHCDGGADWWVPSGQVFYSPDMADTPGQEIAFAGQHFFLPQRFLDPFGHTVTVDYDPYLLMMTGTTDPVGNMVQAENDYRVMQPRLVTDPNGNRSAVAFDALGLVAGTAVMGKAGENKGDSLAGFMADLEKSEIDAFFSDPYGTAESLLGAATMRTVYDLSCYVSSGQPVFAAVLVRETHAVDPLPSGGLKIQVSFGYSDGFGREIQKKIQAEPGPVEDGGPTVSPRWLGSGWTIFNNKGKPVKKYEPFFSSTHEFEFARQQGVSSTLFYDPVGRVVATLHPNHTYEKVVFDPWRQETWDVNDTVLLNDPETDPDVGGFFRHLPETDYLPTWYESRRNGQQGAAEQAAALKAAAHADTPAVAYLDTLGRTFLTIADNGAAGKYETRVELDIEGNQRAVIDAKNREVMRYEYDLLGHKIMQISMDAGVRRMLNDGAEKPLRSWDSRGHEFSYIYDALHRPLEMRLKGGDGPVALDNVYEKIIYGEGKSLIGKTDKELNLRGKPFAHYDTGGKVQFEEYDFKGNPVKSYRQLTRDYKQVPQWDIADINSILDDEKFITELEYDALNRVIRSKTPDGSITKPTYNEANLLEKLQVEQGGTETEFVREINYDAKGQRTEISYGNGARTICEYDPETFRMIHLRTAKVANGEWLQDLYYTYDPVGNITRIEDQARPTVFFNNFETEPVNQFTYDALYRLIEATGREHIAQVDFGGEDNWNDLPFLKKYSAQNPMEWRNYTQQYQYDSVGNIGQVKHIANGGSWTRDYAYETANNRLKSTTAGNDTYHYPHHPQHGFMEAMPHLPVMQWNFRDELQAVARQRRTDGGTPETTYYVYDSSGQRIRKITEHAAEAGGATARKDERIYVGGIEIYREHTGIHAGLERKTLHVMDDKSRIAMVETRNEVDDGSPKRLARYQYSNHLGTACLETDENARIISYEEYHPYGTTSYQAVDKDIKAPAKRYRYTDKERDEETGLYYHGARYYAPWLGRWTAADPLGLGDGINLFAYVRNNPITLKDKNGMQSSSNWEKVETEDDTANYYQNADTGHVIRRGAGNLEVWEETGPNQYTARYQEYHFSDDSLVAKPSKSETDSSQLPIQEEDPVNVDTSSSEPPKDPNTTGDKIEQFFMGKGGEYLIYGCLGVAAVATGVAAGLTVGGAMAGGGVLSLTGGGGSAGILGGGGGGLLTGIYVRGGLLAAELNAASVGMSISGGTSKVAGVVANTEKNIVNRAGQIQDQLSKSGLGFWRAVFSSVSVAEGKVAGEKVTVITHTSPKAYELLEQGVVKLNPGEMLGPKVLHYTGRLPLAWHAERQGINFLRMLGATNGRVATYPLGCPKCQEWIAKNFPGFVHLNAKPGP